MMALAVPPLLWPREERFATAAGRKAHEDEIDRGLAEWTVLRDRDLLANKLQNLGIPAAPVYDVGEVLESPQLVARGFWQWMNREWIGRQPNPSMPYRTRGRRALRHRLPGADAGAAQRGGAERDPRARRATRSRPCAPTGVIGNEPVM